MLRILIVLAITLFGVQANAAQLSGGYLLHVCGINERGGETVEGGHTTCQAYIAGIMDYHNLSDTLGTGSTVDFCVPKDIDLFTLQKAVLAYLKANISQHKSFSAAPAVVLALNQNYPCEKKKR